MSSIKLTDRALDENLPDCGVLILESHHSPHFNMEWRRHDFLKIVFVLRGKGILQLENSLHRFDEGDIITVPPQRRNRIDDAPDDASSLYVCCIDTDLFRFEPDLLDQLCPGLVPRNPHLSNRVAAQLRRMRHRQAVVDRTSSLSMVADALRLVEWIMQSEHDQFPVFDPDGNNEGRTEREMMQRYLARLDSEFYEATTIDAAAESLAMSRRAFTRLFQEVAGTTWLKHVRSLAIRHARHQLAQTNLPIASVAFECGFNELSTFYRQFKSQVGLSPKAYRRSIRQTED